MPVSFGIGWYGALDGGVNVYQSYRDNRTFTLNDGLGTQVAIERQHKIGGFGGIKLGYVFGTGAVRFAVEESIFYNGFQSSLRAQAFTPQGVAIGGPANSNLTVNSVPFMTNFLVRFAPGNQRFQPYIGLGIGGYYASTGNISVNVRGAQYTINRSASNGSFAWNVLAGADYYFNPKLSMFLEYTYLNYNNLGGKTVTVGNGVITGTNSHFFGNQNLGQSLIGAGVRFHF
ncbi:hypothetical protein AYO41_01750 [Verrucomicrobia bacterium SCGC AG-212-E04]|nr:hypothetical protein AYO41_01750 [Verrucomicrobia bacterium SCGC AG-212-E04]